MEQAIILPELWVLPVAALIPVLVALAFQSSVGGGPRQVLSWVLTAAVAVIEQVTADAFTIEGLLATFALVFITQLGVYLGTKSSVNLNERVAPEFGLAA